MAYNFGPEDYLGLKPEPAPSVEQVEDRIHHTMAAGLGQRAAETNSATVGDSDNYKAEEELMSLQQQISRETDHIKLAILQDKATLLASQLVGDAAPTKQTADASKGLQKQSKEELEQDIANKYGDADLILANAAEVLGTAHSEKFNELLDSGDDATVTATMETLKHLRDTPQHFSQATPGTAISDEAVRYANETFGNSIGSDIQVLSSMVNEGHLSSADAIAQASRNPQLLAALLAGAKANMWTISL